MKYQISALQQLPGLAKALLEFAGDRRKILLYGEIGAGKTTFVKAIGEALGITEAANSPTFSLINEYLLESGQLIHHIDLYRLKNVEEAINIGIEDYLYGPSYCFIEWPEIIESILPEEIVKVHFELQEDGSREVIFS